MVIRGLRNDPLTSQELLDSATDGFDRALVRELLAKMNDDADPIFRCRCDAIVTVRGTFCETCSAADLEEFRRARLERARQTLPDWPHADFRNENLSRVVDPRIIVAASSWSMTEGTNLVLLGDTGKGKTTAAVALARHRLRKAKTPEQVRIASGIRMISADDLAIARRKHAFDDRARHTDAPLVRSAKYCELLILDEVGFESTPQKGETEIVFEIMQHRYGKSGEPFRPTIITSGRAETDTVVGTNGESVPPLVARYGEATKRRMTERARVVQCFESLDKRAKGAA